MNTNFQNSFTDRFSRKLFIRKALRIGLITEERRKSLLTDKQIRKTMMSPFTKNIYIVHMYLQVSLQCFGWVAGRAYGL